MIPATLTHYIETEIIPRYEHFDKAHSLSHVRTVIEESLALAKEYDVNESMAYTIAAYHDTGLCRDRATHHLVSGEILKQDTTLRQWFNEEEIETMREGERSSGIYGSRATEHLRKNSRRSRSCDRPYYHSASYCTIRTETTTGSR